MWVQNLLSPLGKCDWCLKKKWKQNVSSSDHVLSPCHSDWGCAERNRRLLKGKKLLEMYERLNSVYMERRNYSFNLWVVSMARVEKYAGVGPPSVSNVKVTTVYKDGYIIDQIHVKSRVVESANIFKLLIRKKSWDMSLYLSSQGKPMGKLLCGAESWAS